MRPLCTPFSRPGDEAHVWPTAQAALDDHQAVLDTHNRVGDSLASRTRIVALETVESTPTSPVVTVARASIVMMRPRASVVMR